MHESQIAQKLKDLDTENAKNIAGGQAVGLAGNGYTDQCAGQFSTGRTAISMVVELAHKRNKISKVHSDLDRAIDILQRHPEFNEVLELADILARV